MKPFVMRTPVFGSLIALVVFGCAQLPPPAPPIVRADASSAGRCAGLNVLSDADVSTRLDLATTILVKIRDATGKTNEQICGMTEPEV
ncbi:MAG: hypothetical protein ABL931_08035, partial [Usitatibacteraceae bacterium]